jgi:hypothetical protein
MILNISRLDEKVQRSIKDSCERIASANRELARSLKIYTIEFRLPFIKNIDKKFFNSRLSNTYGISATTFIPLLKTPVIILNERWFSNYDTASSSLKDTMKRGWHPECDDVFDYLMFHEAAHTAYKNLTPIYRREWNKIFKDIKNREIINDISGYALYNADECFCESVSAYFCGKSKYLKNKLVKISNSLFTATKFKIA